MSRLTNSVLTQAMAIMGFSMLDPLMEGRELTPVGEPTERQKEDLIARREANERERRAAAEKWQAEYTAKAEVYRNDRAARKAAAFAKRQPKR